MALDNRLFTKVGMALNTAVNENEYDFEGATAYEVACDLVAYNCDFEAGDPHKLALYVKLWFKLEKGCDMELGTDAETD